MKKIAGFTMVELMVVIAIAAILATLAAPSFTQLIENNALSSDVNTLLADMRLARNEAVRRGTTIVMCRSANPEAVAPANPVCANGSDWRSGWIVFEDLNGNNGHTSNEPLLRQQGPLPRSGGVLTGSGNTNVFRFVATGRLKATGDADSLVFSSLSSGSQRIVCINMSGRARIADTGSVDCGATN
jgi:type IV fimbrial biogenesis protein FimT